MGFATLVCTFAFKDFNADHLRDSLEFFCWSLLRVHLTGSESMAAFERLKKELAAYRMADPDGEIVVSLLQFEAEDGCDIDPFESGNCLLQRRKQS